MNNKEIKDTTERRLLTSKEILQSLETIPLWEERENKLIRTFRFKNFIEAFAFMTKVAILAESLCHHPEWSNVYAEVEVKLTTHDLNGISTLDFKLAKAIDKL